MPKEYRAYQIGGELEISPVPCKDSKKRACPGWTLHLENDRFALDLHFYDTEDFLGVARDIMWAAEHAHAHAAANERGKN